VIDAKKLLGDLRRQLKMIEDDLRLRINEIGDLKVSLQAEWQTARDANRTAETFESWADQVITQAGVHWLLSCVFLRFIEDNRLVERPWFGGTPESGRLALARDRHESYFGAHPLESDREYFLFSFREAGALPGLRTFFDEKHNPIFRLGISGDAAMALRQFWQQVDPNSGNLVHDFTDPEWNTRFLGDLYQDLSEAARKRYALLQTPEFVEEFILDRTLTPAIREFGYRDVRMIDATCGSGHFVLGAFQRLVAEWSRNEPARNGRDIAQKALDAVAGVDLNPFAVAIARFRLLVAALRVAGVERLTEAPAFNFNLATGDSLLHGKRIGLKTTEGMFEDPADYEATGLSHAYASEDLEDVRRILSRQFHVVVGNPPYIVVKDGALNRAYRQRYASCHRQYSLGAPFTERFFDLAITGGPARIAGFVGLITTNSFMKREFGSKLITDVLPLLDLTHVIDTAGAYIPGHGTPTVILFGRNQRPVGNTIRAVMGIKGEPNTPPEPARGQVWSAIMNQIDYVGSESDFISVADVTRALFGNHPWSIGGGGISDLKEIIEGEDRQTLGSLIDAVGFYQDTHADEIFVQPIEFFSRTDGAIYCRSCVRGDGLRDWQAQFDEAIVFPYDEKIEQWVVLPDKPALRWLWAYRTTLWSRSVFGGLSYREAGRPWWDYHQFPKDRARAAQLLAFSEVATHNHFVLDRGGKVFNRTAPVIKLAPGASLDDHLDLLGLLNSSVACFWLKQVCHNKGSTVDQHGARQRTAPFEDFYAFNSTKISEFPLCEGRPRTLAVKIDALARELNARQPDALLSVLDRGSQSLPTRASLDAAKEYASRLRSRMIALQEELDWHCYRLYGVLPSTTDKVALEFEGSVEVAFGQRAFEFVLARRMAAGQETTTWFERHKSKPITEIPSHWPEAYRQVVAARIEVIEQDRDVGLIERPEYKRRWNTPAWDDLERSALREWLLNRLESARFWPAVDAVNPAHLTTTNRLADAARTDSDFMQIAELYSGHAGFDVGQVVAELVAAESVPYLPALRYTGTGLRKRSQWEETWALQRREDAGEEVGNIPVPPKYQNKDFHKTEFWRLRGSLDVPKERWISYPGCERGADGSLPIAWAGWNHLQQATALASYYVEMKESEGWELTRLQPLLTGLLELVPWLEQWHNDVDSVYGERMGNYYKGFLSEEARALGFTLDGLKAWMPPASVKRSRKKAS
jgi:hypothetical protein